MYYTDCDTSCAAVKRTRIVDGVAVTTWGREISGCCCLEAEAGTNGYQGRDHGHGGRVFLRLADLGGTDFCCRYDGKEPEGRPDEIVIALGGDAELCAVKEALRWWLSILEVRTE